MIKDYIVLMSAFLPDWVVVVFLIAIALFLVLLIIRLVGFVLDAIPFL